MAVFLSFLLTLRHCARSRGTPRKLLNTRAPEGGGRFSPDSAWLAYLASGNVYVQPFPGPGRPVQMSPDGADAFVWGSDGRELFYQRGRRLMAVSLSVTAAGLAAGRPQMLFDERRGELQDISPDGRSFLYLTSDAEGRPPLTLVVTLGWMDHVLSRTTR